MKGITWAVLFSAILFSSGFVQAGTIQKCIEGSGKAKSEERHTGPFTAITTEGAIDVTVVCGQKQAIKVIADDNLLPYVITEVKGSTLNIYSNKSICAKKELKVEISIGDINKINASGAADINISDLDNNRFDLNIDGSGDIKAAGKTGEFVAMLAGASNLQAKGLKALKTKLKVTGSGDAVVFASRELDAKLMGAGDITYYGLPAKVKKKVLGVGDIESGE